MIIKSITIKNLRSIVDQTVALESLTALVGANGSGKSAVLCALEMFYGQQPSTNIDDFYNHDTGRDIAVAITYTGLSNEAVGRFGDYVDNDTLTIERVVRWAGGRGASSLHGFRMQHSGFASVRAAQSATDKKPVYNELRTKTEYSTLAPWRSQEQASEALRGWEQLHPEACKRLRDDGQFFNFRKGGEGDLYHYTRLLSIPAVRNVASDVEEGRGAVITTLLDLFVRSELAQRPAVVAIQEQTLQKYKAELSQAELNSLADKLTVALRTYAPTTSVRLEWQPLDEIEMPTPKAIIRVVEDDFETSAERTGHGVQRAFILALLQRLAVEQSESPPPPQAQPDQPHLLLAIEEPELYQHPNRQRHLAGVFMRLATAGIPGVSQKTQVIYTTHSPLLIGLDRFNQVRICRKTRPVGDGPKQTTVVSTTLDVVARKLWEANGSEGDPFTAESLATRLHVLMTPVVGEGFFADVVILVEGETDQAAIIAAGKLLGKDLATLGVSVIPCRGKSSLDRPALIFRELGIPTYVVWDGDKGKKGARPEENRRLLRLIGKSVEDWPVGQDATCTVFEAELESTLRQELGESDYDSWVEEALVDTELTKEQGLKNPVVFEKVLSRASEIGKQSSMLNGIVNAAIALKA